MTSEKIDYKEWHLELGCSNCVYCVEESLYISACCNGVDNVSQEFNVGACHSKKIKFISALDKVLGIEQQNGCRHN